MNGARRKTNFLQPLLMGNINTFQPGISTAFAACQQIFRFQTATVLVNTSITKSLFIVLSKCLLLVQFCLALVFSPDFHKARAVVLCYVTDATNFQTCVCWPLWSWAYQGQIILLLSARSVLWQISCPTSAFPWATAPSKTPWLCPETIPFEARKKGRKLSIVR